MLRIRLWRMGKKKRPLYRLVVTERQTAAQGAYQEAVGQFDPHTKALNLKKDRILFWLERGVKPTNSVAKLLAKEGVKHSLVLVKKFPPRPKKEKSESTREPKAAKEETAATPEAKKEEKSSPPTTEPVAPPEQPAAPETPEAPEQSPKTHEKNQSS